MIHESARNILGQNNAYSVGHWFGLIRNIMEGKPLGLPITFPDSELPTDDLIYLYEQLKVNRIEERIFESALLQVFDFYRKNKSYTHELYFLIRFFEDISIAHLFDKFYEIIKQKQLHDKYYQKLNLHYLLLTILFDYDNDNSLKDLFMSEVIDQRDHNFYQAALRYFSTRTVNNLSSDFGQFLDEVCKYIEPDEEGIINIIVATFDEITYINKSAKIICNWFRLTENNVNNPFYKLLAIRTKDWLHTIKNDPHFDDHCQLLYDYFTELHSIRKFSHKAIPGRLMQELTTNHAFA